MKYLVLLFVLASCSNIQKATNVNALADDTSYYNGLITVIGSEAEAANCKFISNVKAEDNLINVGKDGAITSMKKFSADKGGDSIVINECNETKTAILPITVCMGKAYKCK